jgi:hypothetical protein
MQENEFDTALLESELVDVKRAATRLADALQDVYNTIGELPEVNRIFSSVAEDVAEHKGMVHNASHNRPSAVLGAWSPIATAPTDGTCVLVSNGRGVWVAKFKAVFQSGWKPACPWQSMMRNHDHIPSAKRNGRPTHWMPLPEAPNA